MKYLTLDKTVWQKIEYGWVFKIPSQENFDKYYKIFTFSKNFLQQLTDTPPEFDKFLKENFRNLLA